MTMTMTMNTTMNTTPTLTPKQQVLKRYPKARSVKWAGVEPWTIYAGDAVDQSLNFGANTPQEAWAQAAERVAQAEKASQAMSDAQRSSSVPAN